LKKILLSLLILTLTLSFFNYIPANAQTCEVTCSDQFVSDLGMCLGNVEQDLQACFQVVSGISFDIVDVVLVQCGLDTICIEQAFLNAFTPAFDQCITQTTNNVNQCTADANSQFNSCVASCPEPQIVFEPTAFPLCINFPPLPLSFGELGDPNVVDNGINDQNPLADIIRVEHSIRDWNEFCWVRGSFSDFGHNNHCTKEVENDPITGLPLPCVALNIDSQHTDHEGKWNYFPGLILLQPDPPSQLQYRFEISSLAPFQIDLDTRQGSSVQLSCCEGDLTDFHPLSDGTNMINPTKTGTALIDFVFDPAMLSTMQMQVNDYLAVENPNSHEPPFHHGCQDIPATVTSPTAPPRPGCDGNDHSLPLFEKRGARGVAAHNFAFTILLSMNGNGMVSGTIIPIDTTSLLLAGTQMTAAWMIPVIVAGIGIAVVLARKFSKYQPI